MAIYMLIYISIFIQKIIIYKNPYHHVAGAKEKQREIEIFTLKIGANEWHMRSTTYKKYFFLRLT